MLKKILVPVDFSPASRNAGEYAGSLARAFTADIYLLNVFREAVMDTGVPISYWNTGEALQEEHEALLHKEISFLHEKYGVDVYGYTRVGFKGDTINAVAREVHADCIVMGIKEGVNGTSVESTTMVTISKAAIPVLVVPERVVFMPVKHVVVATDLGELKDVRCCDLLLNIVEKYDADIQVVHIFMFEFL